jgi:methyltransferase-like protein 6
MNADEKDKGKLLPRPPMLKATQPPPATAAGSPARPPATPPGRLRAFLRRVVRLGRRPLPPPQPPENRSPCGPAAFVGDPGTRPAGAYHDADFSWEDHARAVGPGLEARLSAAARAPPADPAYAAAWAAFHAKDNASARFYKERRYLPLAWPALADPALTASLVELGCGAGSALLPILRANPAVRCLGVDVSPGAVSMFLDASARAGIEPGRVGGLVLDATAEGAVGVLSRVQADACLAVFTLGALEPAGQAAFLAAAAAALRPGSVLYVRDHGLFDLTHLRAPMRVAGNLHRRSDGTLCYFFDPPGLERLAHAAGFSARCCKWVTVEVPNRKTNAVLRRVFVSGEFVKT